MLQMIRNEAQFLSVIIIFLSSSKKANCLNLGYILYMYEESKTTQLTVAIQHKFVQCYVYSRNSRDASPVFPRFSNF